ncbi:hypothetical protein [Bradyrhizobium sp. AZCC 1699]|uniref:hypothetical protein n=1 Tax=Bradyrhizobium sp. AZCC 1699 TaxID=3117024 RepID=UPI002FF1651D
MKAKLMLAVATAALLFGGDAYAGGWGRGPSWKQVKKDAPNVLRETGKGVVVVLSVVGHAMAAGSQRRDGTDGETGSDTIAEDRDREKTMQAPMPVPGTNGQVTAGPVVTNKGDVVGGTGSVSSGAAGGSVYLDRYGNYQIGGSYQWSFP